MPPLVPFSGSAEGIAQLRQKISVLERTAQRFARTIPISSEIDAALPQSGLPQGCVHEVHGKRLSQAIAFASLLTGRMEQDGHVFFIAPNRSFHPLGLLPLGVDYRNWIHVTPRRPADRIWAALEALRCRHVTAVLAALPPADLTVCRQLQLAAEESGATCFLLGDTQSFSAASVITRWRIAPQACDPDSRFDCFQWSIELTYCRGGRPGKWPVLYKDGAIEDAGSPVPIRKPLLEAMPALEAHEPLRLAI